MSTHTANYNVQSLYQSYWLFAVVACTTIFLLLMINDANATAGKALEEAICGISWVIQSNVAKGIATLAIIMLGIGAMLGKVSWSMALLVAVGIAIVFNAFSVVKSLDASITDCVDKSGNVVK